MVKRSNNTTCNTTRSLFVIGRSTPSISKFAHSGHALCARDGRRRRARDAHATRHRASNAAYFVRCASSSPRHESRSRLARAHGARERAQRGVGRLNSTLGTAHRSRCFIRSTSSPSGVRSGRFGSPRTWTGACARIRSRRRISSTLFVRDFASRVPRELEFDWNARRGFFESVREGFVWNA